MVILAVFLGGCGTTSNTPKIPNINTYNTSSTANKNPKSTLNYPGSTDQKQPTQANTSVQQPSVTPPSTIESSTITTTTIPVEEKHLSGETTTEATTPSIVMPPLSHSGTMIKVAVLIPQKTIKKYAITSVNSVMSYLLYRNYSFDMNVFNSNDERDESITKALADIKAGGYHFIIAPVTPAGASLIAQKVSDTVVFIPTVHKNTVTNAGSNIIFGGIDYEQQMALLAPYANDRVGIFDDGSGLGLQLSALAKKNNSRVFYEKHIENAKVNFKQLFQGSSALNDASLYLNTPLVTSSLIASQLRANKIRPHALLSAQINYNPMLLTLTQYEDRDDMFIANSIRRAPTKLEEVNALFGHDIVYDWVNYSTSIGIDLLASHFFDSLSDRAFKENVTNNQVVYNTTIVKPAQHSFVPAP